MSYVMGFENVCPKPPLSELPSMDFDLPPMNSGASLACAGGFAMIIDFVAIANRYLGG